MCLYRTDFNIMSHMFVSHWLQYNVTYVCILDSWLLYNVTWLLYNVTWLQYNVTYVCILDSWLLYNVTWLLYIHVIELLCYNWRFANFWLEIWSHNWRFFYRRIWCVFLLFIDVFLLFVSVLNQLHPISIYIVYICVLLVVFHMIKDLFSKTI